LQKQKKRANLTREKEEKEKRRAPQQTPRAKSKSKAIFIDKTENEIGFCIRTGIEIPFDTERPYSYKAYKSWAQFENYNYSENYCHRTGKESYGKTCMNNPVM
jgi:hypothetical protein